MSSTAAPHNVVFDFDDTLIVSRNDRADVLLAALESFGAPGTAEDVALHWGKPFRDLVFGVSPQVADRFYEFLNHYVTVLQSRPPVACPGVDAALPRLTLTHRLFVHSASQSILVRTDLQTLGLLHHIDFTCGSEWQPRPKPHPDSFRMLGKLLKAGGSSLEGSWYVGDAPTDVDIAAAAGLRFVGVAYTEAAKERFLSKGVGIGRLISDMNQLHDVVSVPSQDCR